MGPGPGPVHRRCAAVLIGVLKERREGERRVALLPEGVRRILKLQDEGGGRSEGAGGSDGRDSASVEVVIERGAGEDAFLADSAYEQAGAQLGDSSLVSEADLLLCVQMPPAESIRSMKQGSALLGILRPAQFPEEVGALREAGVTALSFDALPRITRAQKMDALSSMSTVAGYRAVILGAEACPKLFPMMMTAAGTITAARVLVLGAGVAGLQAIATARRLGAVVEAYDVRAAAKEQVLSLGARFVELPEDAGEDAETEGGYAREQSEERQRRQRELLGDHIAAADVVVTTALIPGRPAPRLIDAANVERMRAGSVIVDLAAEAGGNCELTAPGERIERHGVRILGPLNLPSEMAWHSSQMLSRNGVEFVCELAPKGSLHIDMDNEVIRGSLITHDGGLLHEPTQDAIESGDT